MAPSNPLSSLSRVFHLPSSNKSPKLQPSTSDSSSSQPCSPTQSTAPFTIIELFQSQGCNSCPPTNDNLLSLLSSTSTTSSLSSSDDILLLTYEVTYWDYLGWPDTFGSRSFDQRQRDYVHRLQLRSAFTPHIVVNGTASGVGNTKTEVNRLLQQGRQAGRGWPVDVSVRVEDKRDAVASIGRVKSLEGKEVTGEEGRAGVLEVWVVTYDPQKQDVRIARGENAGRTLPHVNVVKKVKWLGTLDGRRGGEVVVSAAEEGAGVKRVVLVQDGRGGAILGAAKVE